MKIAAIRGLRDAPSKAYKAPTLTNFGHMAQLTKGGVGSITELAAGNKNTNNKA